MEQIVARLKSSGWAPDVTFPKLVEDYEIWRVCGETMDQIHQRYGISITDRGSNNLLVINKRCGRLKDNPQIVFNGSDNLVVIDERSAFRGRVICGSECLCVLMGHQSALNLSADLYEGGALIWGCGSRTYGCRIWVHGRKLVAIGDDCLFSEGISIRTSDHHSIIDLETFEPTNEPDNVVLEKHVWIGPGVTLTRGVRIGKGAIVGAGSLVTKAVPSAEMWAGVPAKCIRQNVSWVDSHPANEDQIAQLRSLMER
jgi:acetyltransferase-like isoleucine patch superfamily enzyme